MIEVSALSKIFGRGDSPRRGAAGMLQRSFTRAEALSDLSFRVEAGQVCGLIGSNGAGKTTLLRILATLLAPTDGTARVAGFDIREQAEVVRRRIGYMPDTFGSYDELRVDSYLDFFAHLFRLDPARTPRLIDELLQLVDLVPFRHRPVSVLSLGARQRLSLARALLHDPKVLLLDEPVSALDPAARLEMRALLRELGRMGKTVLISSHILSDLADLCGKLVVLEKGKLLFEGTPAELRRRAVGQRTLEVGVEERREELEAFLRGRPWVGGVEASDGRVLARLEEGAPPSSQVAALLFEAGFRPSRFLEREVDLEEAFLRITRESR